MGLEERASQQAAARRKEEAELAANLDKAFASTYGAIRACVDELAKELPPAAQRRGIKTRRIVSFFDRGWWVPVFDDNPGHRRGISGHQNRVHVCVRKDSTWVWLVEVKWWYPADWRESYNPFQPESVSRSTLDDSVYGDALRKLFAAVAAESPAAYFEQRFVDFLAAE